MRPTPQSPLRSSLSLPPRRTLRRATLALALGLFTACGGDQPDTASAHDATVPDTTPAAAPGSDSAPAHASAADSARAPATALPPWSASTVERDGAMGRLVGVRSGRHDGFDRLVLVFSDRVPGYAIGYPDARLHQCGSGEPIELDAAAVLHLHLEPASAHNQRGHSTLAQRELGPHLPVLRTARLICDFEGHVEWAVGLERRAPFRAFTLEGPARLVLDFRHGAEPAGG